MAGFSSSSFSRKGAKHLMSWLLCVLIITLLIDTSAARSPIQTRSDSSAYNRHISSASELSNLAEDASFSAKDATIDNLMPADGDTTQPTPYHHRKSEWERRYTSLQSLRQIFGRNQNRLWGDLDPGSARRLYRSLMPRVLMELVKSGVQPEDLAPLAYKARVAAKMYARERSTVPARLAATVYDGMRQWKRYGRFQAHGMTYEQIWEKYQQLVMNDQQYHQDYNGLTEQDLTSRISLKIVERSCSTNESVDHRVLPPSDIPPTGFLRRVSDTLETDVRKLLETLSERKARKPTMEL